MEVTLVSTTVCDWPRIITLFQEDLNLSANHIADKESINNVLIRYLSALEILKGTNNKSSTSILRDADDICDHVSFGFYVQSPIGNLLTELLGRTDLKIVLNDPNVPSSYIITGSLTIWRKELVKERSSNNLRLMFNKIYHIFEEIGLDAIWHKYTKRQVGNTFQLT